MAPRANKNVEVTSVDSNDTTLPSSSVDGNSFFMPTEPLSYGTLLADAATIDFLIATRMANEDQLVNKGYKRSMAILAAMNQPTNFTFTGFPLSLEAKIAEFWDTNPQMRILSALDFYSEPQSLETMERFYASHMRTMIQWIGMTSHKFISIYAPANSSFSPAVFIPTIYSDFARYHKVKTALIEKVYRNPAARFIPFYYLRLAGLMDSNALPATEYKYLDAFAKQCAFNAADTGERDNPITQMKSINGLLPTRQTDFIKKVVAVCEREASIGSTFMSEDVYDPLLFGIKYEDAKKIWDGFAQSYTDKPATLKSDSRGFKRAHVRDERY